MKKSQITIIIIFVFVILVIFGFIFYLRNIDKPEIEIEKVSESSLRLDPIQTYVDSCMKIIGVDGIHFISSRGGYYSLPDNYFDAIPPTAFYVNEFVSGSKIICPSVPITAPATTDPSSTSNE